MLEWTIRRAWRARVAFGNRGFESHPLRQNMKTKFIYTELGETVAVMMFSPTLLLMTMMLFVVIVVVSLQVLLSPLSVILLTKMVMEPMQSTEKLTEVRPLTKLCKFKIYKKKIKK